MLPAARMDGRKVAFPGVVMPETFDPYHKLLGIRCTHSPPDHYRLLGIELFEDDPDVIETAADRQMVHLRTYRTGKYAASAERLLNEVATARLCLLDSERKDRYDTTLRNGEVLLLDECVDEVGPDHLDARIEQLAAQAKECDATESSPSPEQVTGASLTGGDAPEAKLDFTACSFESLKPTSLDAKASGPVPSEESHPLPVPEQCQIDGVPTVTNTGGAVESKASALPITSTLVADGSTQIARQNLAWACLAILVACVVILALAILTWRVWTTAPPPQAVAPFSLQEAQCHQQAWAKHLGLPVETTNSLGMKLRLIPPGDFIMGLVETNVSLPTSQMEQYVHITQPFYLSVYEITQAEYSQIMGANPSYFSAEGAGNHQIQGFDTGRLPVEGVSWDEATDFCRRLGQIEGRQYRLPTEAEWEYACRAGTMTAFHLGDMLDSRQANCDGTYPIGTNVIGPSLQRSTTVGSYSANAFGLHDMHGNVWEWCEDWYDRHYQAACLADNPAGPPSGSHRICRGGGWPDTARECRSNERGLVAPNYRSNYLGFRVVLVPAQ